MRSAYRLLPLMLPLFLAAPSTNLASCDRALRRMEGWTIVKVTQIRGTFEGCESDRLIEFVDGTTLRCSSFGYQYGYMPICHHLWQTVHR